MRIAGAIGAVMGPLNNKDNKPNAVAWYRKKEEQINA